MEHCKSAKTRRSEQMGSTMLLAAADVQTGHIFFFFDRFGQTCPEIVA
jgi:hypothetical protein